MPHPSSHGHTGAALSPGQRAIINALADATARPGASGETLATVSADLARTRKQVADLQERLDLLTDVVMNPPLLVTGQAAMAEFAKLSQVGKVAP